jgi:hypothetical protein
VSDVQGAHIAVEKDGLTDVDGKAAGPVLKKEPAPPGFHPVCLCPEDTACEQDCPTLRYA